MHCTASLICRSILLLGMSTLSLVWVPGQWQVPTVALAHRADEPQEAQQVTTSRAVPPHKRLRGIEPDVQDGQKLYAATPQGLLLSPDGGLSWQPLPVAQTQAEVFAFAVHPKQAATLFVGRADGVWKSADHGRTWHSMVVPGSVPLALRIAESQPQMLYLATARHGVLKSLDGGQQWHEVNHGLPAARAGKRLEEVNGLAVDPTDPNTVYATIPRQGVYRTIDGGQHWHPFNPRLPLPIAGSLTLPKLVFAAGTSPRLYLAFNELTHSHLMRTRLYVLSENQEWLPVEVELPENFPLRGIVADRAKHMLQLWGPELVWEVSLSGTGNSH